MNTTTSSQTSRKAPENRAGQASIDAVANQAASAPAAKAFEVIKLGVDTHAAQYTFARMVDHAGLQPPQRMYPADFLHFLQKQLTLAKRVVMVYEAGRYGFALYRQVTALGVECLVCAPERLSRGRKLVNDKIDARELTSRLDRYLAGNHAALRLVRPLTLAQEMCRRQARERNTYRKDRQRWISRGRSLLHTLGILRPGRWWEADRHAELLQMLAKQYDPATVDQAREELANYLEFVQLAATKLEKLTATLRAAAVAKKTPRVKGLGPLSSELLDREMGDWNRFHNRRQVASYTGLCPGEDSSGDSQRSLSIDKHGNPRGRAVLVEVAWLLPRYQPDYKPLARWKWVFEAKRKAPAAMKKKGGGGLGAASGGGPVADPHRPGQAGGSGLEAGRLSRRGQMQSSLFKEPDHG